MFRLEEEKNSRGTVMSGSAIRGRQGSERFFTLPVATLIASSFVLGMSDFVVVGILPDIAHCGSPRSRSAIWCRCSPPI